MFLTFSEIHDVYVISHPCAVRCGIIVAEDGQFVTTTNHNLCY